MIIDLLKRVSKVLEETQIPYMLSGSVALGLYTVARTTRDIDLVVELAPQDVDKFVSGFSDFFVDEVGIAEEVNRKGMFNIIDKGSAFKVDFIIRTDTTYGAHEFKRRQLHSMDGFDLWGSKP